MNPIARAQKVRIRGDMTSEELQELMREKERMEYLEEEEFDLDDFDHSEYVYVVGDKPWRDYDVTQDVVLDIYRDPYRRLPDHYRWEKCSPDDYHVVVDAREDPIEIWLFDAESAYFACEGSGDDLETVLARHMEDVDHAATVPLKRSSRSHVESAG